MTDHDDFHLRIAYQRAKSDVLKWRQAERNALYRVEEAVRYAAAAQRLVDVLARQLGPDHPDVDPDYASKPERELRELEEG